MQKVPLNKKNVKAWAICLYERVEKTGVHLSVRNRVAKHMNRNLQLAVSDVIASTAHVNIKVADIFRSPVDPSDSICSFTTLRGTQIGTYAQVKKQEMKHRSQQILQQNS